MPCEKTWLLLIALKMEEVAHEMGKVSSFWKLQKWGNRLSPRASRKDQDLLTAWSNSTVNHVSDFQPTKLEDNKYMLFEARKCVVSNLLQHQWGKRVHLHKPYCVTRASSQYGGWAPKARLLRDRGRLRLYHLLMPLLPKSHSITSVSAHQGSQYLTHIQ